MLADCRSRINKGGRNGQNLNAELRNLLNGLAKTSQPCSVEMPPLEQLLVPTLCVGTHGCDALRRGK